MKRVTQLQEESNEEQKQAEGLITKKETRIDGDTWETQLNTIELI